MGATRRNRVTQVSTLSNRLTREGSSHPFGADAVGKACWAIAGVALPSAAPTPTALVEAFAHLLATMGDLCCPHHLACGIVHDGDTRRFAAWVDLEIQWGDDGRKALGGEDDGKGITVKHRCLVLRQQPTGACWAARRQRVLIRIEHKHSLHVGFPSPLAGTSQMGASCKGHPRLVVAQTLAVVLSLLVQPRK